MSQKQAKNTQRAVRREISRGQNIIAKKLFLQIYSYSLVDRIKIAWQIVFKTGKTK